MFLGQPSLLWGLSFNYVVPVWWRIQCGSFCSFKTFNPIRTCLRNPDSVASAVFQSTSRRWISRYLLSDDVVCFLLYKHLLHLKDAACPEMALGWVMLVLLVRSSVALENLQAFNVSQRCMEDTNAFLWEINQVKPKEYAVLSKYCCLLQRFHLKYPTLFLPHLDQKHHIGGCFCC